jgi:hypothetical protein
LSMCAFNRYSLTKSISSPASSLQGQTPVGASGPQGHGTPVAVTAPDSAQA